jgi:NDP-4-keto-2,6-dideoxyhexose 3-C-methyltransferase
MLYTSIQSCRICGNPRLLPILDLGEQALTGVFPRTAGEHVERGPLELVKCDELAGGCGLVQLRHSFTPEKMYGENYGYRSGLNASMVEHLRRRVGAVLPLAQPGRGDLILDIGSNDGTTLRAYPEAGYQLVGIDPTGHKFARYYPAHVSLIPDFFSAATFEKAFPGRKAKIVTSIAMFYDLEKPQGFMADVHRILADDGLWVFEQSYCPAMLAVNAYDTICHEHVSYYSLRQIKWMTDRCGFKIVDVELNDSNGGSFCVTVAKSGSRHPAAEQRVEALLREEERQGLGGTVPFEAFRQRVLAHRDHLKRVLADLRRRGQKVYGYGASTKGNVVLQYCGFTAADLPAIAEVNEDKFGAFTPGSCIPIRSEKEVRDQGPDYLLILPWHFRQPIVRREADYLARGGKLLFPLPSIEVVETPAATRRVA